MGQSESVWGLGVSLILTKLYNKAGPRTELHFLQVTAVTILTRDNRGLVSSLLMRESHKVARSLQGKHHS